MAESKMITAKPYVVFENRDWVSSFSVTLPQGIYLLWSHRVGELTFIEVYSNGTISTRTVASASTTWALTMTNFVLEGSISYPSSVIIIKLA